MTSKSKTTKTANAKKGKPAVKVPAKVVKAVAAKKTVEVKPKPLPVKTVAQATKTVKALDKVAAEQTALGNEGVAKILSNTSSNLKKVLVKATVAEGFGKTLNNGVTKDAVAEKLANPDSRVAKKLVAAKKTMKVVPKPAVKKAPAKAVSKPITRTQTASVPKPKINPARSQLVPADKSATKAEVNEAPAKQIAQTQPVRNTLSMSAILQSVEGAPVKFTPAAVSKPAATATAPAQRTVSFAEVQASLAQNAGGYKP